MQRECFGVSFTAKGLGAVGVKCVSHPDLTKISRIEMKSGKCEPERSKGEDMTIRTKAAAIFSLGLVPRAESAHGIVEIG